MITGRVGARLGAVAVLLLLATGTGLADQYWVAYEGNDYPENEGWWRIWYDIPAERSLEDGCLILDTRADVTIAEFYEWNPTGSLDPQPGEMFIMQWRFRIDEIIGLRDPSIVVSSDDAWSVGLRFAEDSVRDAYGDAMAGFAPGVFHVFELRSPDMREYELRIDGDLAWQGSFWHFSGWPRVAWGPGTQGAASLTRWDYVRFGVVPEPSSLAGVSILVVLAVHIRRRSAA